MRACREGLSKADEGFKGSDLFIQGATYHKKRTNSVFACELLRVKKHLTLLMLYRRQYDVDGVTRLFLDVRDLVHWQFTGHRGNIASR